MVTVQQVKNCIESLELLDPADPAVLEKAQLAFQTMGKILYLALDLPANLIVFHTRTHDSDELYTNFHEIECPKPEHVKNFGRCNLPNKPVFYCSEDRSTSYAELLQYWIEEKKGKFLYVTISKWQLESQLRALIVPNPDKNSRTTEFDKNHGAKFDNLLKQIDNEDSRVALVMFFSYIHEKMRKAAKHDLKTYIITSSYCDYALSSNKSVDAILYPSVPFNERGHNIAIKQGFDFDDKMKLLTVYRNKFERFELGSAAKFQEAELLEANNINRDKRLIEW
ncbi:RES domain-containing protein [Dyadobacter soli]|uniref:RES domain-containing protein n=1 Tax=Dyadobacter soli TaxID=659014 RepID=A0A1G6Y5G1_9BACT|nr:RES domain-containing protein [Dyadobacter soli]SDD85522.1 RES domain-containing protein [Dyadobacter soli]